MSQSQQSQYKVVVINGSGTSGKDYFIKEVESQTTHPLVTVYNRSSVDTVKWVCGLMGCKADEKTDRARNFYSDVKDAWVRYNNGPFNEFIATVKFFIGYHKRINVLIFYHVREAEEILKIKDHFGKNCMTLLVRRPDIQIPDCKKDKTENVEAIAYDQIIENDGSLKDIESKANEFLKGIYDEFGIQYS